MKEINVCFASDNGYAIHLGIAIYSLLKNLNKNIYINIYILDGGITEINKKKISFNIEGFKNKKINYLKINNYLFKDFPCNIGIATYYRLEIINLLGYLDNLLYLDCDLIVNGDISTIFNFNIKNKLFGAVSEITLNHYYKDKLLLNSDFGFFNAGVLLFNIKNIKDFKLMDKVKNYILENKDLMFDNDQQALNILGLNKWSSLPPKFNALPFIFYSGKYNKNLFYSKVDFNDAYNNPIIIHYAGEKPWKFFCDHPLKDLYWRYRNETCFADFNKKTIDSATFYGLKKFLINKTFTFFMLNFNEKFFYLLIYKPKQKLKELFK